MRYFNTLTAALILSMSPAISCAFDADVKQLAESKQLTAATNKFSQLIDIPEYGGCSLAHATIFGVWGAGKLPDKNSQLMWEAIGNGLAIYRQNFVRQYRTEKPLGDVIKQMSGEYFNANMNTFAESCMQIMNNAAASVR